jgi:Domain of unknown function (DUF4386)
MPQRLENGMVMNRAVAAATEKPGMSADRKAAVWIGVLYIIGTVGMVHSVVVTGGILTGPDYLAQVAAQPNQVAVGALLLLLAGLALALVPVVFWPVGRRYNETLAIDRRGFCSKDVFAEGSCEHCAGVGWVETIAFAVALATPSTAP